MGNTCVKSKKKLAFEICAVTKDAKNMDATEGDVVVVKIMLYDDHGNCSRMCPLMFFITLKFIRLKHHSLRTFFFYHLNL